MVPGIRNVTDLMGIEKSVDGWCYISARHAQRGNRLGEDLWMEDDFHEVCLVAVQAFKPFWTVFERSERGKHGLDADGA